MEQYLWKFDFDCGRMGSLDGLFIATEKEVKNIIGKKAYFGEVLGKHSEVYGVIKETEIEKVDLDSAAVEKVSKILGKTWSGFNPLNYIKYECPNCGEEVHNEEFNKEKGLCWNCSEEE
jgi:hypothetical protein